MACGETCQCLHPAHPPTTWPVAAANARNVKRIYPPLLKMAYYRTERRLRATVARVLW